MAAGTMDFFESVSPASRPPNTHAIARVFGGRWGSCWLWSIIHKLKHAPSHAPVTLVESALAWIRIYLIKSNMCDVNKFFEMVDTMWKLLNKKLWPKTLMQLYSISWWPINRILLLLFIVWPFFQFISTLYGVEYWKVIKALIQWKLNKFTWASISNSKGKKIQFDIINFHFHLLRFIYLAHWRPDLSFVGLPAGACLVKDCYNVDKSYKVINTLFLILFWCPSCSSWQSQHASLALASSPHRRQRKTFHVM